MKLVLILAIFSFTLTLSRIVRPQNVLMEPIEEIMDLTGDTVEYEEEVVYQERSFKESGSRSKRSSPSNLMVIETFIVTDWGVYENFMNLAGNDSEKAIEHIRFHLSHVMLNVNTYYSNMEHSAFKFRVKVNGIRITTKREDSPYSEYSRKENHLDIFPAFAKVKKWAKTKDANIPPNDLLLIYSGYTSTKISGVAVMNSVCRQGLVFISLGGIPRDSLVTAHEIAHTLSAEHDSMKNNCPEENYIMNRVIGKGDNPLNIYRFSTCSVNSIDTYTRELTATNNNCLQENNSSPNEYMDISALASEMPGLRFNVDQQCQIMLWKDSYHCPQGAKSQANICQQMACYQPSWEACITTPTTWAVEATSCGDKKWCYDGMCVEDYEAPAGKEYCMFGDATGAFMFNSTVAQCEEEDRYIEDKVDILVKGMGEKMCGEEVIKDMCCEMCKDK